MLLKLIPMPSNFNIQKWISIQILPSLSLVNYEKYTWLILIWRRKGIFYTTEHNVTCLDMPPYVTITPPWASCRSTSVPLRPLTQFSAKRGEGRAFTISLFLKFHQKEILILYHWFLSLICWPSDKNGKWQPFSIFQFYLLTLFLSDLPQFFLSHHHCGSQGCQVVFQLINVGPVTHHIDSVDAKGCSNLKFQRKHL